MRWFFWNGGQWVWPNPIAPSSGERRLWTGSSADLWFHDGGDGTDPAAATPTTGAMWMVDSGGTPPLGVTYVIKRSDRVYYTP